MGALFCSRDSCRTRVFKVFIDLGVFEAKKCWRSIKCLCKLCVLILHRQNIPRESVPLRHRSLVFPIRVYSGAGESRGIMRGFCVFV